MAAAWEIPRLQEYGRPSKMFPKGGAIVFDFEKPIIEIAEISEDKRYGKFVVEPAGKRLWYHIRQFFKKNYAFLFAWCSSKSSENRRRFA